MTSDLATGINQAIAAHSDFRERLVSAIAAGQSSLTVERVCQDNQCTLGRWLYTMDGSTQATPRWQCVRTVHAEFHQEAARVLEFALAGKARDARSAIAYSSAYTGLSRRLTTELEAWKNEAVRMILTA